MTSGQVSGKKLLRTVFLPAVDCQLGIGEAIGWGIFPGSIVLYKPQRLRSLSNRKTGGQSPTELVFGFMVEAFSQASVVFFFLISVH